MPSNFREFSIQIDQEVKDVLGKQLPLQMRRAAFELWGGLIFNSPVGNPSLWASLQRADGSRRLPPRGYTGGAFRGAWFISRGRISDRVIDRIDPAGTATRAAGLAEIARWDGYSPIWMINNMPYAARLADGWSTQAPDGWVKVEVARVGSVFRRAA